MICDTLDQLHLYKGFHKNLDTAIEFLAAHPLETLPLGRTEVDGDEVFINVMDADLNLTPIPTPNITVSTPICRST